MTNEQPLVSIALCTYNGAAFISAQLDSIIAQTYSNWELVITDDCSADNTVAVLQQYAQNDPRIQFHINEKNIGYNKNFEKAIGLTRGDFIAISDQDDIWDKEKIAVMMQEWPEGSSFVFSLSSDFDSDHPVFRPAASGVHYHPVSDTRMLVFSSPVHGHAMMFKRSVFHICQPFPAAIFYDWWMSMHAASIGTIGCIPHTLTYHRVHSNNSSRDLTSISDKQEKNRQLRRQCKYFLETFCAQSIVKEDEKKSLLEYAALLGTLDTKKFSLKMVLYVMKNRRYIFHYKKKKFAFFSHLKRAIKMGSKGLL
jgi:glycosyltransferase involved in cell wall biosynthesis